MGDKRFMAPTSDLIHHRGQAPYALGDSRWHRSVSLQSAEQRPFLERVRKSPVSASAGRSDLHVHDVGVCPHELVAHGQRGMKADLRFLHRHHRLLEADRRVVELQFALQML